MRRVLLATTVALLFVPGALSAVESAETSSKAPLRITSSLDGKKVLPIRSRWLAFPKVPSAKVAEVHFLIDGKVRCVERYAPYNYGSDDRHGHLGWLVTSWLAPGKHRFTARAILTNGRSASRTVVARVLPAPEPPAKLAGRWTRTVTEEEVARVDPTSVGDLPTGKWELVFDRIGVWELDPAGSGVVEHVVVRKDVIRIDAGIWMTAPGRPPVNRYGHRDIGFGFREDGPPASYRWSLAENELRLTVIKETRGRSLARQAIWEGTWTRVR